MARSAKNELKETDPLEMLKVLHGDNYAHALTLHKLGEELGCAIDAKSGATAYKISYSLKKPKKSLFTIECSDKKFRVKANLFSIEFYDEPIDCYSKAIKEGIKSTRPCSSCNPRCVTHIPYLIDGEKHLPCYGSGHYFTALTDNEWNELYELIKLESKAKSLN